MTSPGGQGARPSELFMEKAAGQEQQLLNCFRCGRDGASSWPGGATRAGRADEGGGGLDEAASRGGGRALWSLPGDPGSGHWAAYFSFPPVQLCMSLVSTARPQGHPFRTQRPDGCRQDSLRMSPRLHLCS